MLITDFDYHLPMELIAQYPSQKRDEARLLVVDRKTGEVHHKKFYDILEYLKPGDCLVMNDSKVLPARMYGVKKETGAKAEILLIKRKGGDRWEAMVKPGKKLKPGSTIVFSDQPGKMMEADILDYSEDGTRIIEFRYDGYFHERLEENGNIPLPPYIERSAEDLDKQMYQTVYCREEGSVAAPTAGLHFTEELLQKVAEKGVKLAYVTLHVGIGTFRPVKCDVVEEHHMHFEEYSITEENAAIINKTKEEGGRVISVGTTSTRTMESAADENGRLVAGSGSTDIFIYPGYSFKIVDNLITNFHLPKSTLLMLISAMYDREKMLDVYREAVAEGYHFFSYGDAMFID
ncbi:MAG: tRNA preQ1(34) S-adenosylmethionine ribosyltransferase-isomerase QueA [Firmicutes bacterium]|nr:tRNA preQ1(34) S-adenosylmethionine ribosyltransferase-isomerase QueA [Bacillota bacterium]